MRNTETEQQGFTITELLIAVAVASIASILIMSAFVFMYGGLIKEQVRAQMVLESQAYLRKMVEDIRVANQVLSTNTLPDAYGPVGGWVTSDPANILVITQPATDNNIDFIYDTSTGYPFQNEIIYFSSGTTINRRVLANAAATGNKAITTCPSGTPSCQADTIMTDKLKNMLFVFYDIDDVVTIVPEDARSVSLTVNLSKKVYGEDIDISNTTRVTLRNEN